MITAIEGVEEAKNLEGIYEVHIDKDLKVGARVEPITDHTKRKGYVIAIGETREQAVMRAEQAIRTIKITTNPIT